MDAIQKTKSRNAMHCRISCKFQNITMNNIPFQGYKMCTYLPDKFDLPGELSHRNTLYTSTFFFVPTMSHLLHCVSGLINAIRIKFHTLVDERYCFPLIPLSFLLYWFSCYRAQCFFFWSRR